MTTLKLFILILLSNTSNIDKTKTLYYLSQVQELEITSAIILLESGNLKCTKCALKKNNLFGFETKKGYLSFDSYSASVKYYLKWQQRKYNRFKRLHPDRNYFDFLKWVKYSIGDYYNLRLKQMIK